MSNVAGIWVYLSGSPLFALTLTLCAYQIGLLAHERFARHPLANPVAIAVLIVATSISVLGMPYAKYFEGAQFVHFLLGTATVSLAVPVYHGLNALRGRVFALAAALVAGAVTSVVSAVVIARLLGADRFITGGLYAKSLTTPIAMGVAERIGASPTLTAVYALITGLLGAVLGRYLLDLVGCRVWWQRGFVIGIAAHGIGTSRAFAVHPEAGAYASLAMGLHGICAAVLLPWIVGSV
jgi:putative effector of murein hydrolase